MDLFDVFNTISNIAQSPRTDTCRHVSTCIDSNIVVCTDCGCEIDSVQTFDQEWRNYQNGSRSNPTRCVARKTTDLVIMKDLEKMDLGKHIVSIANDMYVKVTKGKIKRGKSSRQAIIAACLFHAYKQNGTPKSCDMMRTIMKDTNLDKSDFLHGIKQVALNLDKSMNVHNTYITPVDIIGEFMALMNSTKTQLQEVVKLYNSISSKTRMFRESRPQSVAAGVVYKYISREKNSMSIKIFSKKVGISELTINKIISEINRVLADN